MQTRTEAVTERMDTASQGLGEGPMRWLGRMLAIVDHEHEEDHRVFVGVQETPRHYTNLREAARTVVDTYRREREEEIKPLSTGSNTMAFRMYEGECTAVFVNTGQAGRLCCYSDRDGSFSAKREDVATWPETEPTRRLLVDMADIFWSKDE